MITNYASVSSMAAKRAMLIPDFPGWFVGLSVLLVDHDIRLSNFTSPV